MTIIDYINVWMQNTLKVKELKVNWDDKIRKLIHRKCHPKSQHDGTKCHVILNTLFSVAPSYAPYTL